MRRRDFLAGSAASALAAPAVRAAGDPKLLKFVPQSDIALLDPDLAPALGHPQPRLSGLRHAVWRR